jgi:hypothetical protein
MVNSMFQPPSGSERDSRFSQEYQAGLAKPDVMITGSAGANARLKPAGMLQDAPVYGAAGGHRRQQLAGPEALLSGRRAEVYPSIGHADHAERAGPRVGQHGRSAELGGLAEPQVAGEDRHQGVEYLNLNLFTEPEQVEATRTL